MKTLIVYDSNGKIFYQASGSVVEPTGLTFLWVEIPQGQYVERVDVTDPANPKAVLVEFPKTEIEKNTEQVGQLNEYLFETQYQICCMKLGL